MSETTHLVLDVEDGHWQASQGDLFADDAQRLLLVLHLVADLQALRHAGLAEEPLSLVMATEKSAPAVPGSRHGLLEVSRRHAGQHHAQVLSAVRLDAHKVARLDVARGRGVQSEVAVRAFELHLIDVPVG